MVAIPLRSDRAYMAWAKQSSQGVGVAPSLFPRWLDGSSIQVEAAMEDIWENDSSRRLSFIIKNNQKVSLKHVFYPRPNEAGFFETAAQGAGGDTLTAATVNTTLSALTIVGAASITVAAQTGLTGTGTITLVLEPGTATEEIATFNLPATGAGPYTLTVASTYNGGHLLKAHASAGVVQSPSTHTITDQADGNYYSIEVSLGDMAGIIIRVRDCKLSSIKRSCEAGHLLAYETEWEGLASIVQATPATITRDSHQPFLYTSGVWTLDGSLTGDALEVQKFSIEQKNNLDWIQTEQIIGDASIFGMLNVGMSIDVLYQSGSRIAQIYFGGTSGTADSPTVFSGSLLLVFTQADGFHTLQYSIPTMLYTKVGMPQPKHDGKAWWQTLDTTGTSNQGQQAYVLQTTVANTNIAAY